MSDLERIKEDVPLHPDTRAMNEIALVLGRPVSWASVDDYLGEVAGIIASTGRPSRAESASSASRDAFSNRMHQFRMERPRPRDDALAQRDWDSLNEMARQLFGAEPDFGLLEELAEAVARTGRPHPGGSVHGPEYEVLLSLWMGAGPHLPTAELVVTVDDRDLPDNPFEPWTASATWRSETPVGLAGVGGGATIPDALRDLALDLETRGVLRSPPA